MKTALGYDTYVYVVVGWRISDILQKEMQNELNEFIEFALNNQKKYRGFNFCIISKDASRPQIGTYFGVSFREGKTSVDTLQCAKDFILNYIGEYLEQSGLDFAGALTKQLSKTRPAVWIVKIISY